MPENERLSGAADWIDIDFVEREQTHREIIEKGVRYHLAGPSLSNTVIFLDELGVKRSHTAVHNWGQKAELQPAGGARPDRVTVDQKAIRINDDQYWLYAAVDPATNRTLHRRLFPTYTVPIAREFLTELAGKHDSPALCFSSMMPTILLAASAERVTAIASNSTAREPRSDVFFARYNDEPLRSLFQLRRSIYRKNMAPSPRRLVESCVT